MGTTNAAKWLMRYEKVYLRRLSTDAKSLEERLAKITIQTENSTAGRELLWKLHEISRHTLWLQRKETVHDDSAIWAAGAFFGLILAGVTYNLEDLPASLKDDKKARK